MRNELLPRFETQKFHDRSLITSNQTDKELLNFCAEVITLVPALQLINDFQYFFATCIIPGDPNRRS